MIRDVNLLKASCLDKAIDDADWLIHNATHLRTRLKARKAWRLVRKIHHYEYKGRDHALIDKEADDVVREIIHSLGEYINCWDSLHATMLSQHLAIAAGRYIPNNESEII